MQNEMSFGEIPTDFDDVTIQLAVHEEYVIVIFPKNPDRKPLAINLNDINQLVATQLLLQLAAAEQAERN